MKKKFKRFQCILVSCLILSSTAMLGVNAEESSGYIPDDTPRLVDDEYNDDGFFSGYVPDDEKRLTGEDDSKSTSPTENIPLNLTDNQKQQIKSMMDVAQWYTSDDSIGNPVVPPYDETYTTEMGEISDQIMDYGNSLLNNIGNVSQFKIVNSNYARLLTMLERPIINARFAAYSCYLSYKDTNNYNNWYDESDWQQFISYRDKLYTVLTAIDEDYLNIESTFLTYEQKKSITTAFFDLLELYDKMTLDDAVLGDVDGDGQVSILDVTDIQRNLAEMKEFTQCQKLRATINVNASKNGVDYAIDSCTFLQRHLVGMDSYLPAPLNNTEYSVLQSYNFPVKEIRPTHLRYPNPETLSQQKYRNVSIWNPIICITNYSDKRLEEIESLG